MKDLKTLLKEELRKERRNQLIESLTPLHEIKNDDFFFQSYIKTAIKLIDEGYEPEEIRTIAEQTFAERLAGSGLGAAKDLLDKSNLKNALWGGGMSAIGEQIIGWILSKLGMGKDMAHFAATFLADTDPRFLLKVFKSPEMCYQHMDEIIDSFMEAIVRRAQDQSPAESGGGEALRVGLRNVLADIEKQSDLGERIGTKLCNVIWKKEELIPKNKPVAMTPLQQPQVSQVKPSQPMTPKLKPSSV